MMEKTSGKIIHIDFGDCFEVAMSRDRYPEKIPFRLTRMLINAMEVTGVEGTFLLTCHNVMNVLRSNKESLMAVLEAFVYDPLINWRLLTPQDAETADPASGISAAVAAEPQVFVGEKRPPAVSPAALSPYDSVIANVKTYEENQRDSLSLSDRGDSPVAIARVAALRAASNAGSRGSGQLAGRKQSLFALEVNSLNASSIKTTATVPPKAQAAAGASTLPQQRKGIDAELAVTSEPTEALNEKAVAVMTRVMNKLTGRDFKNEVLEVPQHVQRLMDEATAPENLCTLYIGWCPFW